jgi:medium-chain acyl-[acyl-carrier-protein] hydrolase
VNAIQEVVPFLSVNAIAPFSAKKKIILAISANEFIPSAGICFPYAGGSARVFYSWLEKLDTDIELCPVELPGHGRRLAESPYTRLFPLVEAIASEIAPFLDRAYAFFGHSMGALLAFELTRHLREQEMTLPDHLFLSGRRPPQFPDDDPPTANLSDAELIEKLRWLRGTPPEILENDELRELLFPVLRADFAVCETYEHTWRDPLPCPITAFGGRRDPATRQGELRQWRHHTSDEFSKKVFGGNHFFLHSARDRLLPAIAQQLKSKDNSKQNNKKRWFDLR